MAESWLKLHTEILTDPKIKRLKKTVPNSFEIWIKMLCICKEGGFDNCICISDHIPYSKDELADEVGVNLNNLDQFINEAIKLEMIEIEDGFIYVANWEKRQYSESKKRVEKFRQAQKKKSCNDNVTELKRNCNDKCNGDVTIRPDKTRPDNNREDKNREDKNREDKNREDKTRLEKTRPEKSDATEKKHDEKIDEISSASVAAVSFEKNLEPESEIVSLLLDIGVNKKTALDLIEKFPDRILPQIDFLPGRKSDNPAALLVKAIREDWEKPSLTPQQQNRLDYKNRKRELDAEAKRREEEREQWEAECSPPPPTFKDWRKSPVNA